MLNQSAIEITILLATYNGAKYVGEQIDSILQQTHTNWRLLIRDDKSTDATPQIIADYQSRYPHKIVVVEDSLSNLGGTLNFGVLLQKAKNAEYIMLCDQDDFWLPDKIEVTLAEMLRLERQYGREFPLLVHTNFHYVNSNLKVIKSREDFQATKIVDLNLCHLLAQNPVYGCTMMINNKLVLTIDGIPAIAENHDYWVAMVASAFGKISYLHKKTILYRQHGANLSGSYSDNSIVNRFRRNIVQGKSLQDARYKVKMAEIFKKKYLSLLSNNQIMVIDDFMDFSKNKHLSSVFKNLANGVRRQTRMQTLLFYVSAYLTNQ